MNFSERLSFLYALCLNETSNDKSSISTDLQDYDPLEAANYLACYITFKAIREAERSPADERLENFDMLSVYHAYAMLVYAFLMLPLGEEGVVPDTEAAAVIIAKTLFAGLSGEEWAEIIESGSNKFRLIAEARQEHWVDYRQDLDKATVAFVIAGTDEETPFDKDDVIPMFGALLSMLCEAFASD
ncbi:hypothetical protein MTYP_00591 [Methylophilaceae bacterium]|nr:hypothetical protein MTYP_00591 [Methylophilaceae bacterium]